MSDQPTSSPRRPAPPAGAIRYGPVLTKRLTDRGIPAKTIARLAAAGVDADFLSDLLETPGLADADDVQGLLVFVRGEYDRSEIMAWARLGSLSAAYRLDARNVSLQTASGFPLVRDKALKDLLRVAQVAHNHGIRTDDMLLWVTGGVLSLTGPHIDEARWATWRAVAVHRLGSRRAAAACGAGMSPQEAVEAFDAGTFDEVGLRMMAGLRAGL